MIYPLSMRLWIKTYAGDFITRDTIIELSGPLTRASFEEAVTRAAHQFDLSTPIILSQHYIHFRDFNSVKFLPRDFIDEVDFDKFFVENCL